MRDHLAVIASTGFGTSGLGKHPPDAQKDSVTITLRVYDYVHENRSALLLAEGEVEATRILRQAGVNSRWVDCPTSRGESNNYPDCYEPWQANDYVLEVLPDAMAVLVGTAEDALGWAAACIGPYCTAIVFYDRVMGLASGTTAAASVLLGRAMAHEIGHLLLGANAHSTTGIMRASWFPLELRLKAGPAMLFTDEQSRQMKTRLTQQVQSSVPGRSQNIPAAPAPISRSAPETKPRVTLRIYNYARLDSAFLTGTQQVVAAIFKGAGVEIAWIDCPLSPAEFEKYPACHQRTEATHFILRVMPASMAVKLPTSDHPLGFAHECRDDQPGCVANIFYARVAELARRGGTALATVLGHVIAHEVGHLLLGPNSDASRGIMCGEWSLDDLRLMNWHYLLFTPEQSGQLRDSLLRRSTLEAESALSVSEHL
ncbi:MAG TPA: hypothetical protein VMT20_27130 [Terriglobia bacterium]|nr:hypothetical protein [Terriglobia bacterium]